MVRAAMASTIGSGNGHHGVGKESLELVEAGLAEAVGAAADSTRYGTTNGVVLIAELGNLVLHGLRHTT